MQNDKVRELTKMAMCVALCCVTAYISFPLPFTPGMVTALTFALSLAAYLLTPRQTFTVIAIYILLGAIGLPVLGGGQGLARLVSPAGGFYFAWLLAYPLMSLAKGNVPNFKRYVAMNILIAMPVTYAGGIISMILMLEITLWQALTMAVFPFVFSGVVKVVASALLGVKLNSVFRSSDR